MSVQTYVTAVWQKLVTKEKAIFKSATMWYGAVITALPTLLPFVQQNWTDVAKYVPHALQDPILHWVGAGILLARMKSLVPTPSQVAAPK